MKRVASIVFLLGLAIAVGFLLFLAWSRPPDKPAPLLSDDERAKYAAVTQQVLDKNPALKAEDVALKSQADLIRQQKRSADDSDGEARRALEDHDRKIMEEGIKIDPSIEGIYFRMRGNYGPEGNRELIAYDSQSPFFRFRWHFVWEAFWLLAAGIGLFLLVKPPSYAGANLYLTLALLPALVAGPMALTESDWSDIYQLSGIYDGPTMPQLLLEFHHDFVMAYLSSATCLVLYAAILFRIYRRSQHS